MTDREEVFEEAVWEAIRNLGRKIIEAQKIASSNAPFVQPDAEYLTFETLSEIFEELKQKFPEESDRELFEDLRASLVRLKKLVDTLVLGATLILLEFPNLQNVGHETENAAEGMTA